MESLRNRRVREAGSDWLWLSEIEVQCYASSYIASYKSRGNRQKLTLKPT